MAEAKINGNLRINDGTSNLRTLKELNNQVTNSINDISKLTPICLYDRSGKEGPNLGKTGGIQGSQSVSIDMTSYKKIKVYGIVNTRKYQWSCEIDLNDPKSENTFNQPNVWTGTGWVVDNVYDELSCFSYTVSISHDKKTFKADRFLTRPFSDMSSIAERQNNENYYVSKIYGIK